MFHSVSVKTKIIGVGIKDVPDKRTERPVQLTFQEYSKFNCYGLRSFMVILIDM